METTNHDPELSALNREYERQLSVERYILDQMDEDEASEFEAFFLSNQECLDQLELAERLYEGMQLAASAQTLPMSQNDRPDNAKHRTEASNDSPVHWWKKPITLPGWAAAAMVLVLLLPSMLLQQQTPADVSSNTQEAPGNGINVVNLRSSQIRGEAHPTLNISAQQQNILAMFVDTELDGLVFHTYQFQLRNTHNHTLLSYSTLTLDMDDMLYINLGSDYLKPGTYQFSISGNNSNDDPDIIISGQISIN